MTTHYPTNNDNATPPATTNLSADSDNDTSYQVHQYFLLYYNILTEKGEPNAKVTNMSYQS